MIGTFLNVGGIVLGSVAGLVKKKPLSLGNQFFFKAVLGALTTYFGLRLTWMSINGPLLQFSKEFLIIILSLILGRITGRLLRLQKASNRLGVYAKERMSSVNPTSANRFSDGFNVCTALFCAAPLGILGAVQGGLSGYYHPLVIKAVMDGLAAMSFVGMFGWGVVLSGVPVLVFQGTITLACARWLQPILDAHHLVEPVNATGGILVVSVALIIFEIRRIEVTDYLPSLVFAPLLALWAGW